MKKKFKNTKVGKILGSVVNLAADSLPFGTTVKNIFSSLWIDNNEDSKIQFGEIRWDLIGGLIGIAVLLRFEIITVEGLTQAANVILKVLGG
ncbi:MAG: hypothetical protein O2887_10420 [Bacteroidetes bacterium]|nr:hypothetical protein [Bacteroidota bacterium]